MPFLEIYMQVIGVLRYFTPDYVQSGALIQKRFTDSPLCQDTISTQKTVHICLEYVDQIS